MENNNFEIKIFANVSGFSEGSYLGPQYISDFFGLELIKKRNFDGDGDSFSDGTFSVFFTPNIYVITLHFDVTSEAKFRSNRVHMAVAIKRLYKLNNPREVFNTLRIEFLKLSSKYKDSITSQSTFIWEPFVKTLQVNVVPDTSQPKFAVLDTNIRSLVVYDTDDQLDLLLKELHREEFENIGTLYILKKIDNNTNSSILGRKYNTIPITNYEYKRTFILLFPDGHKEIIESLNCEVNHTCQKKFFKDKVFKGKLSENMAVWGVQPLGDNRTYSITCQLEPQKKEYTIKCIDEKGKECPDFIKDIKFNPGEIKGNNLVITGPDIAKNIDYIPSSQKFSIKSATQENRTIILQCQRLFCCNLSDLFNDLKSHEEYDAKVTLYDYNSKPVEEFDKRTPIRYLTIDSRYIRSVKVSNLVKYKDLEIPFDLKGELDNYEFQSKATLYVEFNIKNEDIIRDLYKNPIYCTCNNHEEINETFSSEKFRIDNLFPGEYEFVLSVKGYKNFKTEKFRLEKKIKPITISFQPDKLHAVYNFFDKYGKCFLIILLLVLSFTLGYFTSEYKLFKLGDEANEKSSSHDTNIADSLKNYKASHLYLINTKDSLQDRIIELEKTLDNIKNNVNAATATVSSHIPHVDYNLVTKLKGINFTSGDVKKLTRQTEQAGDKHFDELIASANACLKIVNNSSKNRDYEYIESALLSKLKFHKKLKDAISKNGKLTKEYKSIRKKNFSTVSELINKIGN